MLKLKRYSNFCEYIIFILCVVCLSNSLNAVMPQRAAELLAKKQLEEITVIKSIEKTDSQGNAYIEGILADVNMFLMNNDRF